MVILNMMAPSIKDKWTVRNSKFSVKVKTTHKINKKGMGNNFWEWFSYRLPDSEIKKPDFKTILDLRVMILFFFLVLVIVCRKKRR